MQHAWISFALAAVVGTAFVAGTSRAEDKSSTSTSVSTSNPGNCKVVERKSGTTQGSGGLSSSVTAGNGKVSGSTTGGNSVTVHSGDGQSGSSVATTGSGGSSSVVVGAGTDNCVIYVDPGTKEKAK